MTTLRRTIAQQAKQLTRSRIVERRVPLNPCGHDIGERREWFLHPSRSQKRGNRA